MSEIRAVQFNGHEVEVEVFKHDCLVCGKAYEDNVDVAHLCSDCDNEYAEWIAEKGLVIGEFDDKEHPNYQPDVFKGTKWEVLEG